MARTVNTQARKEKRDRILEAAVQLFPEYGYAGTTFGIIAESINISAATILLYFKNKEELFRCAVVEPLEQFRGPFYSFMEVEGTPLDKLRHMLETHIGMAAVGQPYIRLAHYVLGQFRRFPAETAVLDEFGNQFTEKLAAIIEEGQALGQLQTQPAWEVAWAYFGFYQGVALTDHTRASTEYWTGMQRTGLNLFAPVVSL
ncbi:TetR/AcrR family transcriptional regulator [Paenibacillus xylaniclasticus]|uniref:TetR/AcrR family transcriptional regulator n=1 Tax=Paenibacillus xylaniclasticus TaxID=588083 RepID=UPI0013E021A7|nr:MULTISPECIES: TetR/AcrR family transcriptional regulator [Paenibacillus]GFN32889.1 TetR family transcriptional regulator [Paenibacillus curdlanolyticus]